MALPLTFNFITNIIEVPSPDTTLDIQYLLNQVRNAEDELTASGIVYNEPPIVYSKIADAVGKDDIGGGVFTGITLRLLNNWQVRFEARPGPTYVQVSVTGGNLVGGLAGNPIATTAFTQVKQVSSAASTIAVPATADEQTNLRYLVESLRGAHGATGTVYYWDPFGGSDSATGLTPATAVKTFSKAHSLVTAGNYDVINCLSTDASGITTVTETLSITKNTLKVRGPGYTFQLKPTVTTADTLVINANTVEVAGLYISTAATGTKNAVTITGNNNSVRDSWIANVMGNGIELTTSAANKVTGCAIEHCGLSATGNGIKLGNSATEAVISRCIIFDNVNGISLAGTGLAENIVDNNIIYNHTGYGVTVGSGVLRTHIRGGNTFNKNTAGDTQNLGTNTFIESIAGGATASQIAAAVWDEVITGHLTASTTGRTLSDAKKKATLASLK